MYTSAFPKTYAAASRRAGPDPPRRETKAMALRPVVSWQGDVAPNKPKSRAEAMGTLIV
jgi:hypothetical protein